jgi:hypothetical protein
VRVKSPVAVTLAIASGAAPVLWRTTSRGSLVPPTDTAPKSRALTPASATGSGGRIVNDRPARLALPARSIARTVNTQFPTTRRPYSSGDEHGWYAALVLDESRSQHS